jgi:hypothetical protein
MKNITNITESGDGLDIPSENQQPVRQDMPLHGMQQEREEVDQDSHGNEV